MSWMSKKEQFDQMRAALQNILDISRCDFAKHQAAWGLGTKETTMNETACQDFQSSKIVEDEGETVNELTWGQIISLPSGRELDKLVALYVMGYEAAPHREGYVKKNGLITQPKRYSSDIAAAWEVEEKIKELSGGKKGLIIRYMTRLMNVVGEDGFDMLHATPEQRCKAALLAVMGL